MGARILNQLTGEAALTDKGAREYRVVFDIDAVMAVESMTGKTAMDLMMGRPGVRDCIALILAGTAGYGRRNAGAPRVNENLAKKIFADSGGLMMAPVLAESMSCAEGMGLTDDDGTEPDGGDDGPLPSPPL